MNLVNWALYYRNLGWSVIPVIKETKQPAVNWKEFQNRIAEESELRNWFQSEKNNLGIVTGNISNLSVIDVDVNTHDGLKVNSPIAVKTGRGTHYYFKYNPNLKTSTGVMEHVDIRSDGGFVLSPPSIHYSGKVYQWICGTPKMVSQLPQVPREFVHQKEITKEVNKEGWITEALSNLKEGNRNATLTKIIGNLHDGSRSYSDILSIVSPHGISCGLSQQEIESIVRSVMRYERPEKEGIKIYSFANDWDEYKRRADYKSSFQGAELSTGFSKLDNLLFGIKRGEIYTVGARPKVGKTTFCVNVSTRLCRANKRVLYLSTEMSFDSIWDKFLGIWRSSTSEYGSSTEQLEQVPFYLSDISNPTEGKIKEMLKEVNPHVLVFDHIQHMGDTITNRVAELSLLIKKLKDIARESNIAIIVVSQLGRGCDLFNSNQGVYIKPELHNFKGCGGIEEVCTAAILLYKKQDIDESACQLTCELACNRYGDTGTFQIQMDKKTCSMVEI